METSTASLRSCLSFNFQRPIVRSKYCSIPWESSAAVKAKLNLQRRSANIHGSRRLECRASSVSDHLVRLSPIKLPISDTAFCLPNLNTITPCITSGDVTTLMKRLTILIDLDPATARTAITILSPLLPAFAFLFVVRIVMSWYPKLPVGKLPYVLAYAPTEPLLKPTRKLIPPVGGVDVTPVVWFGLLTFINEILVGPQGLLVLLSQQIDPCITTRVYADLERPTNTTIVKRELTFTRPSRDRDRDRRLRPELPIWCRLNRCHQQIETGVAATATRLFRYISLNRS